MTTDSQAWRRELGIDFGDLATALETQQYPTTVAELLATLGDAELGVVDGTRTLEEVLAPLSAGDRPATDTSDQAVRFDSPADVREAIIGLVDDGAIGRKYYSDRTPPAMGEQTDAEPESI